MKIKSLIFISIVLILLAGSINVDAALITAGSSPATEPWKTEVVDATPNAYPGQYVSVANHPVSGRAYISYYDGDMKN